MIAEMINELSAWIAEKDADPRIDALERDLQGKLDKLFVDSIEEMERALEASRANPVTTTAPMRILEGLMAEAISGEILEFLDVPTSVSAAIRSEIFSASKNTMNRLKGDVLGVLSQGASEGLGVKELAERLRPTFNGMRTFELRRIARTEIKKATGRATQAEQVQAGVQFKQWLSSKDSRVRDSHTRHSGVDGEIVRIDGVFSNGLRYPGDSSGRIEEWINCRCSPVPFIMPRGKMPPPGKSVFRVGDLVSIPKVRA